MHAPFLHSLRLPKICVATIGDAFFGVSLDWDTPFYISKENTTMKRTTKLALFVCLTLLACALMFTACDSNNETPTTNEPNDTKTE